MVSLPLPFLSRRLERPALALIEPYELYRPTREEFLPTLPPNSFRIETRWPSAMVMMALPGEVPGGDCYAALDPTAQARSHVAWETWVDVFLAEAIDAPALAVAEVAALGPDRDLLAMALLRAWHWIPEEHWARFCREAEIPPMRFPDLPAPGMQEALRFLARTYRRLPSELLALPFPAFVFNYRIALAAVQRPEGALLEGLDA